MVRYGRAFPLVVLLVVSSTAVSRLSSEEGSSVSAGANTATDEAGIRAHVGGFEAARLTIGTLRPSRVNLSLMDDRTH
jgi:hypothetical protein